MNAVSGIYLKKIFVDTLGCKSDCILNGESLPNFGGKHPDPNCKYSSKLLNIMGIETSQKSEYTFGVALDGDADRHMILGD